MSRHQTQSVLLLFICGASGLPFDDFFPTVAPPVPVKNVSCVIDNFDSMTCFWCPQKKPTDLTKWLLQWKAGSASGKCSQLSCKCTFCHGTCPDGEPNSFVRNATYVMNITTLNDHGMVHSVMFVSTTQHIVKLRKQHHLDVVSGTSKEVQLSWSQPEGYDPEWFDVVYEVQCTKKGKNETEQTVELTNNLTYQLTHLHPFTSYNIRVRCRPIKGHLWSDPLTITMTTSEEAPSASPTIPPGSFQIQPCSGDKESCQSVMIFWQAVTKEYCNGIIHSYEVSFHKTHTSFVSKLETSLLSATLPHLDSRHGYIIGVEAINDAGKSPMATIFIPSRDDLPHPAADLVAEWSENRSHITFSWAPPTAQVENYTFFWCELIHNHHGCQGPVHYRVLPANVTEMVHTVRSETHVYAMSANSYSGSSGMAENWICVYDYNELPAKPVFSFDGGIDVRNVTLSWQQPTCSVKNRGRALGFTLQLWKNNGMLEEFTLPASISSYTVTNLQPNTDYTFKMAAVAHVGPGEFYVKQVHTLETKPDLPPMHLKGRLMTDYQVALTWSYPPLPNVVIHEYIVIARIGNLKVWDKIVHKTSYIFEADGGITYNITVVAMNRFGRSSEATPIIISTPVRAPAQINRIQIDQFNETVAMLTWSQPIPSNGPIDRYDVQCELRNENEVIICVETASGNETEMFLVVKCNDTKVFMDVRIAAVNLNGTKSLYGLWSSTRSIAMCTYPVVGGLSGAMIAIIAVLVIGVVLFVVLFCVCTYRRRVRKKLVLSLPEWQHAIQEDYDSGMTSSDSTSKCDTVEDKTSATCSWQNYDSGISNNMGVVTCNGSGATRPFLDDSTSCFSESGSYATTVFMNGLHIEPNGEAATLFCGDSIELENLLSGGTAPVGKIINNGGNVVKSDKDSAVSCQGDLKEIQNVPMPHRNRTVNGLNRFVLLSPISHSSTHGMPSIMGNPTVSVFPVTMTSDQTYNLETR